MSISLVKTINLSGFAGFNFPGWIRSVETVLQWMQVIFRGCSFCLLHVFYASDSACSRVRTTVVQSHITPAFTPSHIYTHTHTQSQKGKCTHLAQIHLIHIHRSQQKKNKHFYSKPEPFIRSHPFMWTCCCFYTSDLLAPVSHQRIPSNKISQESSHCVLYERCANLEIALA